MPWSLFYFVDFLKPSFDDFILKFLDKISTHGQSFNQQVDEIFIQVDQLEQNLNEVEQFYSSANKKQPNTPKGSSIMMDKDRDKLFASFKRRQQDGPVDKLLIREC
ncbi:Uncharacterized protein Adt_21905 [Abeliophyllum distichum]|uniref:Uncharacterized protein n=1 Tax=Abeliophyllum distichum TaxID=126358 RepID=A0ABD1T0Q3_9LAMI